MLWIAFKNLYLWHRKQHSAWICVCFCCCELLLKICIFDIGNSQTLQAFQVRTVVNCFQKFVSLTSETAYHKKGTEDESCELLSKICIFDIGNSRLWVHTYTPVVVNCFQKFVSLTSETAHGDFNNDFNKLWIAFKNLYLWHRKQHWLNASFTHACCELLSKICIFDIGNSYQYFDIHLLYVVNCFQKFVSLTSETAAEITNREACSCELLSKICIFDIGNSGAYMIHAFRQLWIAFKNLYLWHRKQPGLLDCWTAGRCELLSKICIFDIGNSRKQWRYR